MSDLQTLKWWQRIMWRAYLAMPQRLQRSIFRPVSNRARLAYDGARQSREQYGWMGTSNSANNEIRLAGPMLRQRSRDLIENNPYASSAIESVVSNMVGTGLLASSATGVKSLDAKVDALWRDWSKVCDSSNGLPFIAQQALACRSWLESGEMLVRLRRRSTSDGLPVPFEIQMIEIDQLDSAKDGPGANGGTNVMGIAFDGAERRRGYYLLKTHPGDNTVTSFGGSSVFVGADEVAHLFRPLRVGQARGVPMLAPVISRMRDLADYQNAQLVHAKIAGCLTAFMTGGGPTPGGLVESLKDSDGTEVTDLDGNPISGFEPGLFVNVPSGMDVEVHNPSAIKDTEYVRQQLHAVAAGIGATYEILTKDLSQVNFSSIKAGLIEFRRLIKALREQIFIPLFCERVRGWFIDAAIASGQLQPREGGYPVKWSSPMFESIDRESDAKADALFMRNGTHSPQDIIAAHGKDPMDVLEAIAAWNDLLDKLGIVLDSNPKQTNKSGGAQVSQPSALDSPEDDTEAPDVDDSDGSEDADAEKAA